MFSFVFYNFLHSLQKMSKSDFSKNRESDKKIKIS